MTEQEAKDWLKAISVTTENGTCIEQRKEALFMGMQALEKQMAKPLKTADIGYTIYGCPNCDYTDSLWSLKKRDKHCPNCGQALDWGNEDAE